MKTLLHIACLVLCTTPAAHAQVYECPKFYPSQDTVLAEVPYQHEGQGVVARRVLTSASVTRDDFNKPSGELYGSGEKKVKGGVDIDFPANVTWFVCWYGEGRTVAWWEKLKPDQGKVQGCTMQIRDDHRNPKDIKLVCK
jgi:hypothetical protein